MLYLWFVQTFFKDDRWIITICKNKIRKCKIENVDRVATYICASSMDVRAREDVCENIKCCSNVMRGRAFSVDPALMGKCIGYVRARLKRSRSIFWRSSKNVCFKRELIIYVVYPIISGGGPAFWPHQKQKNHQNVSFQLLFIISYSNVMLLNVNKQNKKWFSTSFWLNPVPLPIIKIKNTPLPIVIPGSRQSSGCATTGSLTTISCMDYPRTTVAI